VESYLLISGIQHFLFCPRQWGLIHIEQQWAENFFTAEGEVLHNRVHDRDSSYKRGEFLSLNSLKVSSDTLKIEGVCDAVEFHASEEGVELFGRPGRWTILPIEYKRGATKPDDSDVFQVVAQAVCLEEKFCCSIEKCAIYYGKTHSREYVIITDEVRNKLRKTVEEMHRYYNTHTTPKAYKTRKCNACSLMDICIPSIFREETAFEYIQSYMKEEK
jgi:CRISPR-associated exonuclease Cas4